MDIRDTLALVDLVQADTASNPRDIDGYLWAECNVERYAARLAISTVTVRRHLECPEFVVLSIDGPAGTKHLVRLAYTARTPAPERLSLLKEIFRDAVFRWRKDEEAFREKATARHPANASPKGGGLRHEESMAKIEAAYLEAMEFLESDPETCRHLIKLESAWGLHAPYVLRVVVDEWWNFLGIANSSKLGRRLTASMPPNTPEVPNLRSIAYAPIFGLVVAIQGVDRIEARLSKSFVPAHQVRARFQRLLDALDHESEGLDLVQAMVDQSPAPDDAETTARTRKTVVRER